jgi:hypothetical protein
MHISAVTTTLYIILELTTTGIGRNWTTDAKRSFPIKISMTPKPAVLRQRTNRVVGIKFSSLTDNTKLEAIELKKINPASCTCPTAKGRLLKRVKHSWWVSDEKRTSLIRAGMYGTKA